MNVIRAMKVFSEVAKQGGFAAAARSLHMSTSAVSRQVIEFEEWLGVVLLQRTTRRLSLTDEGAQYLQRCERVIEDVQDIRNMASAALETPTGTLRLTAPVFLAKECLQALIPKYLSAYPDVKVALSAVDRFVNLVDEGFDLALRIGEVTDANLVALHLMDIDLAMLASPGYLQTHGVPESPVDLADHNCIIDTATRFRDRWPLTRKSASPTLTVSGTVTVDNGEIARNLAVAGLGVVLLPRFFALEQLQKGELVSLLDGYIDVTTGLYAVYPRSRLLTSKVRCFIDHLSTHIAEMLRRQAETPGDR